MRARSAQPVAHSGGKGGSRHHEGIHSVEVEETGWAHAVSSRHRHVVGVHETLRVLRDGRGGSQSRHEGVEVHSVLRGEVGEVQLHRQHVVLSLHLGSGTNHAAIVVGFVASRTESRGSGVAIGHIVAEHLHTVDVSNDTELVIQLQLVGSHAGNAIERFTEVLGASNRRSRAESHRIPIRFGEGLAIPTRSNSRGSGGHFPLRSLHYRVVEGKRVILLSVIGHERLQHRVPVDAGNTHPGASTPRITSSVQQLEGVLAIRGGRKAELIRALFAISKCSTRLQYSRTRQNLVRFFGSSGAALFRNSDVDLSAVTRQLTENSADYS